MRRKRYPRITVRLGKQGNKRVVGLRRASNSDAKELGTQQSERYQTMSHRRKTHQTIRHAFPARSEDKSAIQQATHQQATQQSVSSPSPNNATQPYYQTWQPVHFSEAENNEGQQLKLLENLVKEGTDLSGIQLEKACLNEIDLNHAYLLQANLSGAMLLYANLSNALLAQANLSGAALFYANLQDANLIYANLRGADLTGADLTGADLTGADLTGSLFRGPLQRETRLCHTILPDGKISTRDCPHSSLEES